MLFASVGVLGAAVFDSGGVFPSQLYRDAVIILLAALVAELLAVFTHRLTMTVTAAALLYLLAVFLRFGVPENLISPMLALFALVAMLPVGGRIGASAVGLTTTLLLAFLMLPELDATYGEIFQPPSMMARLLSVSLAFVMLSIVTTASRVEHEKKTAQHRTAELEKAIVVLTNLNVGFQQYAHDVEFRAKEDERRRITRDIHDTVGHMLSVVSVMLDAAIRFLWTEPRKSESILNKAREQTDIAHTETRKALHALRSLETGHLHGVKSILRIVDNFSSATGVTVKVDLTNSRRTYGSLIDAMLCRLVQESLTNAFQHGRARNVELILSTTDDTLQVVVQDDGVGSQHVEEGIGFVGMRERLSQVGGTLSHVSLQVGFRLIARIPLVLSGPGIA